VFYDDTTFYFDIEVEEEECIRETGLAKMA
jgi:hypothetical protein